MRERKPVFDLEFGQIDPLRDTTSEILRAFPRDQDFMGLNRQQKGTDSRKASAMRYSFKDYLMQMMLKSLEIPVHIENGKSGK